MFFAIISRLALLFLIRRKKSPGFHSTSHTTLYSTGAEINRPPTKFHFPLHALRCGVYTPCTYVYSRESRGDISARPIGISISSPRAHSRCAMPRRIMCIDCATRASSRLYMCVSTCGGISRARTLTGSAAVRTFIAPGRVVVVGFNR